MNSPTVPESHLTNTSQTADKAKHETHALTHTKTTSKSRLTIICKAEIINPRLKEKMIHNFIELTKLLTTCKTGYKGELNNLIQLL